MIKCGSSADVKALILCAAERLFEASGLLDDTPQRAAGLRVMRALLASPDRSINFATWNHLVPSPMVGKPQS